MSKNIFKLSFISIVFIVVGSCKKGDTGGDATIAASPMHHERHIKGATLYIKFDAKDKPSDPTTDYDLKIVGESNEDHIHVEGLRYGKYYLYGVGFDSTIMQTVKGGVAIKIKWSERKKEIDIDVPINDH